MKRRPSRSFPAAIAAMLLAAPCGLSQAAEPRPRPAGGEPAWSFVVLADPKPIGDTADDAGIQKSFGKDLQYLKEAFIDPAEPNRPAPSFVLVPGDFDPAEITDKTFAKVLGEDLPWVPVIGNHDLGSRAYMALVLKRYEKKLGIRRGPDAGPPGQYAFRFRNALFVAADQYASEGGRGGKARGLAADANRPALGDGDEKFPWVASQLRESNCLYRIATAHEPAWPFHAHTGDPLHARPEERDRFWKMLSEANCQLYFCGHTHAYSTYRWGGNADPERWQGYTSQIIPGPLGVWQVDAGRSAGPGSGQDRVLVYCKVTEECIEIETHVSARAHGGYALWQVPPDAKNASYHFKVLPDLKANLPPREPAAGRPLPAIR